jgi:PhnB protein
MAGKAKPVPEGFHTATPYMIIKGAAQAIEFYKKAFGAKEVMRHADPNGQIRHAQIMIGNSPIMITDEWPESNDWKGPLARGGTPVHIYLYVENVDILFNQAIAAGAKQLMPLADQFYGDRVGGVTDPFGHIWYISTHIEDVSDEEMKKRAAAAGKK